MEAMRAAVPSTNHTRSRCSGLTRDPSLRDECSSRNKSSTLVLGFNVRVSETRRTSENLKQAGVAQLVEQLIRNQQVNGSSPFAGSSFS